MKITKHDDVPPAKPPLRITLELDEVEAAALAQLVVSGFDWSVAGAAGIGTKQSWSELNDVLIGYASTKGSVFQRGSMGMPFEPKKKE